MSNKEETKVKVEMKDYKGKEENPLIEASIQAVEEDMKQLLQKFSRYWEVKLLWGETRKFREGTYVVKFTSLGRKRVSKSYLHHMLKNNNNFFKEVFLTFSEFAPYIDENMLASMIDYATALRAMDLATAVEEDELIKNLDGFLREEDAIKMHVLFQNELLDLFKGEADAFGKVSTEQYVKEEQYGFLLDTPKLVTEFGDSVVAVDAYTLMYVFSWEGEPPEGATKEKFKNSKFPKSIIEILNGWKESGLLIKTTEFNRLNQMVTVPWNDKKGVRYYLINCPKAYPILSKGGNRSV